MGKKYYGKSHYHERNPKGNSVWKTVVIILCSILGTLIILAFIGIQPFSTYKNNIISTFASATSASSQVTQTTSSSTTANIAGQSTVLGLWNYKITNVIWVGNTVSMNIDITNIGNKVLVFGASNELALSTDYKLCLVDSYNQIYWSKNDAPGITAYFYNVKYYPNETKGGKLEFTVNANSGPCYLYLYWASNPRNKLLLLGSPK